MDEQGFFRKCIKEQRFPKSDLEKQIILKLIMRKFKENKIYKEQEVNEIIKEFFGDFALIRRELINFGYMQRNPWKSEYKVIKKELSNEELEKINQLQKRLKDVS